jgi:hypothetical protein
MISQARLEANRRNAKKSTGPRSEEGKRRSSLNAITHGMTARIALLPDEDPAAFDRRMVQWVQRYRPQDDGELFQAERAAYSAWLVQRSQRAQSARLVFKAQTALDEKRNREERESMELALRLFRLPGGGGQAGAQGASQTQDGLAGDCLPEEGDDADHPALLVLGLEASEMGCRWLLDRWSELKAVIDDEGPAWQTPERFKAIRLLRLDARDVMHAPAVITILQACQLLDPDGGSLVDGYWNELLAANAGWSMERLRAWVPEMALPADQAAARQELADIVKRETDRLELKLEEHEEIGELEAKYSAHGRAFDHSPEGERMRRYETTCNRYVDRYFSELSKRKSSNAGSGYAPAALAYTRPRAPVFQQADRPSVSPEKAEMAAMLDSIRKREGAGNSSSKFEIRNPNEGMKNGTDVVAGGELRNEPKVEGVVDSAQDQTRTEVRPKQGVGAAPANGGVLRNEAKPATGTGAHRGTWQPKAWDHSRRARRAREAMGRAAGRREKDREVEPAGTPTRESSSPV